MEAKKTILYDRHLKYNAKMVEFGGFLMPIEYNYLSENGLSFEHMAVRSDCGLFDVSHMGEIYVSGKDTMKYLNYMITSNIEKAPCNRLTYGLFCMENGCVVDDLMVYKYTDDYVLLVVNASNVDKDFEWLIEHKGNFDVKIENKSASIGQIALQGPNAIKILQNLTKFDLSSFSQMEFKEIEILNKKMLVSRSGYTGEDGFEIYGKNQDIIDLFDCLVEKYHVRLCGLGCRDTLRFEASMPLYGHEISDSIKPVEACLNYAIAYDKDFIGKDALLYTKEHLTRKLVGIELIDRGIARAGYELVDINTNDTIGFITTGYLIPNHTEALALGFVDIKYAKMDTIIGIKIRHNIVKAKIRDRKFMIKKYVK